MFVRKERKQKREEERIRKLEEEKKEKRRWFSWLLVLICGVMALGSMPSFATVLFGVVTVMLLPIRPIDELWNKLLHGKKKWIKNMSLGFAFILACCFMPVSDTTNNTPSIPSTEVVAIESTESADTESTELAVVETEVTKESVAETESGAETETKSAKKDTATATPSTKDKTETKTETTAKSQTSTATSVSLSDIPAYSGNPYVAINNNVPFFTDNEMTTTAFENYSSLDTLGRCGVAYANVCTEIMPTEERGAIGQVKPSGWHTVKYDIVSGKYLYNRCHLIGYQLSAENANTKNLITGTRYLNTEGMLPFENMVADYVKETGNHVLYRVTPMFDGNNLLASGVLMEAKSVEDNGAGILFNVFCYNVQPGITIDYATGDSALDGTTPEQTKQESKKTNTKSSNSSNSAASTSESSTTATAPASTTDNSATVQEAPAPTPADTTSNGSVIVHITDTGSKYHNAGCRYLKSDREVTLDEAKAMGLTPCSVCNPPQ